MSYSIRRGCDTDSPWVITLNTKQNPEDCPIMKYIESKCIYDHIGGEYEYTTKKWLMNAKKFTNQNYVYCTSQYKRKEASKYQNCAIIPSLGITVFYNNCDDYYSFIESEDYCRFFDATGIPLEQYRDEMIIDNYLMRENRGDNYFYIYP